MQLYTSLVRLKQFLNGGALPPMTPIPVSAQHIIDPVFTIGLGALEETEADGIRCPVRECGRYMHVNMRRHWNTAHADIGGAAKILRALSIPQNAPLVSSTHQERMRLSTTRLIEEGRIPKLKGFSKGVMHGARECKRAQRLGAEVRDTVGARNLRNRCIAQLSHALIDVHHRINRSPTREEAAELLPPGTVDIVKKVFGSWNNAKAHCGLEAYANNGGRWDERRKAERRSRVLDGLAAWHDVHGELPRIIDAQHQTRAPLLPGYKVILSALGTDSWREAMRRAASLLNIYGGRYGLPETKSA